MRSQVLLHTCTPPSGAHNLNLWVLLMAFIMLQLVWRAKRALALCILSFNQTESMTRNKISTWVGQGKRVKSGEGREGVGREPALCVCYKWWSTPTFYKDLSLAPHATAKDLKSNLCYASFLSLCISSLSYCLNVDVPRTIRTWEQNKIKKKETSLWCE